MSMLKDLSLEYLGQLKVDRWIRTAKTQALVEHKDPSKFDTQFFQLFSAVATQLITRMGTKITWRPWVVDVTDMILREGTSWGNF